MIELETRTIPESARRELKCECGAKIVVVDDAGSIGCSANCGWEGIHLELEAVVIPGDQIEWAGE